MSHVSVMLGHLQFNFRITFKGKRTSRFNNSSWNTVSVQGLNNCSEMFNPQRRRETRPNMISGESLKVTISFHYRDPMDRGFDPMTWTPPDYYELSTQVDIRIDPTSNPKPTGQTVYHTLTTPRICWEFFLLTPSSEFSCHSVSKPSSTWNFFVSVKSIFSTV
jgi:hypothetical protein